LQAFFDERRCRGGELRAGVVAAKTGELPFPSPFGGGRFVNGEAAKLWARSILLSHDGDFSLVKREEDGVLRGERMGRIEIELIIP
jgi:hypothetical protein